MTTINNRPNSVFAVLSYNGEHAQFSLKFTGFILLFYSYCSPKAGLQNTHGNVKLQNTHKCK